MQSFTSIQKQSLRLVKAYRRKAQCSHAAGKRAYYLPCEELLGGHCAAFFENDLESVSVAQAVRNHTRRCPRGQATSVLGLVGGVVLLTGISFGQFDPCSAMCLPFCPIFAP